MSNREYIPKRMPLENGFRVVAIIRRGRATINSLRRPA
jgi:hypothetical protein